MDILKKETYKENLRFFVFKIDFNDYYSNKKDDLNDIENKSNVNIINIKQNQIKLS